MPATRVFARQTDSSYVKSERPNDTQLSWLENRSIHVITAICCRASFLCVIMALRILQCAIMLHSARTCSVTFGKPFLRIWVAVDFSFTVNQRPAYCHNEWQNDFHSCFYYFLINLQTAWDFIVSISSGSHNNFVGWEESFKRICGVGI